MFTLREFIKKGFINAIGKMADYQIILNAAGWFDKGVLTEEDLAEINTAIDNKPIGEIIEDNETTEETDVLQQEDN